ncbi:ATP-binding cassette sub-family A member 6 [Mycena venus]|uniref:ATP-binding cassette sub-family A member 6 n=1 Tax=Mycena venus TaxID=2733690 RepID=A0A8H7CDP2_9AGAR|nr:ATP-binding cassette sub-family A member 6 [Mycena venus]
MLVASISASGNLLPMQAVFLGKTIASCPSPASKQYAEALVLAYALVPSLTSTYWSNHGTMHDLIDTIIAPYFEATKKKLGLLLSQVSIWKIDCWSVHKSAKFREWMKANHPNIILLFVPGSCTGVWQPLDVGIQHLLKMSIKCSAHRELVDEALGQIQAGKAISEIRLNTKVGVLRDRSVGWIVQAIHDVSDPANRRSFSGPLKCAASVTSISSHASLTSPEALGRLRRLRDENPTLHAELTQSAVDATIPASHVEEDPFLDHDVYDDCDIPVDVLAGILSGGSSVNTDFSVSVDENGGLARTGHAEKSDVEADEEPVISAALGRGQRKKRLEPRAMTPHCGRDVSLIFRTFFRDFFMS